MSNNSDDSGFRHVSCPVSTRNLVKPGGVKGEGMTEESQEDKPTKKTVKSKKGSK
jgi:hypothetical protein